MADNSSILSALKGVDPAEAMPFGAGATPEGAPTALSSMISGLFGMPQKLIENSQQSLNTGNYDPKLPMEAAMGLAGIGAPAAEAGAAGIFGGRLSATADHRMADLAEKMAARGAHPQEIRKVTGWEFSPTDNKWKYEIPDNKFHLNYMPDKGTTASALAGNMFTHPDLFKAYPHLRDVKTNVVKDKDLGGLFDIDKNTLDLQAPNYKVGRSVGAHELQHGVQNFEGFAPGSNQGYWQNLIQENNPEYSQGFVNHNDLINQAFKGYQGTAGEVEARNVQQRLDYTPLQRLTRSPLSEQFSDSPTQFVISPETHRIIKVLKHDPNTNTYRRLDE